jgi:DNA invertase Pin-like site-specific DNA recombinase
MTPPIVAIGYIRRSAKPRPGTRDERDGTASLEAQEAAIRHYTAEQGWTLAEPLVTHNGKSGGRRDRFAELDAAIAAHGAKRVIAYHLDRVGRDVGGVLDWLAQAAKGGIELHVVGRGRVHTTSSSDFLATGVEALVADHFRRVVAEKTRDALAQLRSTGRRYSHILPYGFQLGPDGRLKAERDEQAALVVIARLRARGYSLRRIAAALASRGILARSGNPFRPSTLARLVRDRAIGDSAKAVRSRERAS